MPTQTLLEGAVTFAAAGWSGSGFADDNLYLVDVPFGPITAGLDQSGLTTGIESLEFFPGSSGTVGGGSLGALLIDADSSADAFVNNYGHVTLYLSAAGGSGVINRFACGPNSRNYLMAGSFPLVVQDGGMLVINADFDMLQLNSGSLTVPYFATDADSAQLNGGKSEFSRVPTAVTINGGTHTIDADDAEGLSGKTLNLNGGYLVLISGAFPTVNLLGGTLDLSKARKVMVLGGAAATYSSACKVIRNDARVDVSAIIPTGSSRSSVGAATPI